MPQAKVITRFYGAADGDIYPRWFSPGEVIHGDLALSEIQTGRAEDLEKKPPENKGMKGPPRNKLSLSSLRGRPSPKKT